MAGEVICIGVGTGSVHDTNVRTYAAMFNLPVNQCESNGEYICVGIGTGAMAAIHAFVLTSYANANSLPVTSSCP